MRNRRLIAAGVVVVSAITPFLGRESYGVFTDTATISHLSGDSGTWPETPFIDPSEEVRNEPNEESS